MRNVIKEVIRFLNLKFIFDNGIEDESQVRFVQFFVHYEAGSIKFKFYRISYATVRIQADARNKLNLFIRLPVEFKKNSLRTETSGNQNIILVKSINEKLCILMLLTALQQNINYDKHSVLDTKKVKIASEDTILNYYEHQRTVPTHKLEVV